MKKTELKDRLKEAMDIRELKQIDLVEKGGFDKGQLSSWLSGKYKPRQKNIDKLSEILNVDEAWLMGYDVVMHRKSPEEKFIDFANHYNDTHFNETEQEIDDEAHSPKLNPRDERDIKKDLDSLMGKLSEQEYGPAAFDGEDLSPEAAELFKEELEIALKRLKLINKEKYNPYKNKK